MEVNNIWQVAQNAFALIVLLLFLLLIYLRVRRQTVSDFWDDIKGWVGK
jgi:hypothetical protein